MKAKHPAMYLRPRMRNKHRKKQKRPRKGKRKKGSWENE